MTEVQSATDLLPAEHPKSLSECSGRVISGVSSFWDSVRFCCIFAASALSAEQFTRDLGGSFHSVRDTLLHLIGGEWIWLAYWKEPSELKYGR
jgi:hypothetical protein